MDPGLVAASLSDRRDSSVLLKRGGVGEALSALSEGYEESWRECWASTWQGAEELVVGQGGAEPGDRSERVLYGQRSNT